MLGGAESLACNSNLRRKVVGFSWWSSRGNSALLCIVYRSAFVHEIQNVWGQGGGCALEYLWFLSFMQKSISNFKKESETKTSRSIIHESVCALKIS